MFGRLQLYIIGGIMIFAALTGIYYSWRKGIEREALLEYNQQQLEQNVKDKEEMRKQLEEIDTAKREIEERNTTDKKAFKEKLESISSEIATSSDRPASKVLKDTVNKLKDVVK